MDAGGVEAPSSSKRQQLPIPPSFLAPPHLTPALPPTPCSPSYPASSPPSPGARSRPRPARSSPDPVSQPLPRSLPSGSSSAPTRPRRASPTTSSSRGSSRSSPASRRSTLPRCAPVLFQSERGQSSRTRELTVSRRLRAGHPHRFLHHRPRTRLPGRRRGRHGHRGCVSFHHQRPLHRDAHALSPLRAEEFSIEIPDEEADKITTVGEGESRRAFEQ